MFPHGSADSSLFTFFGILESCLDPGTWKENCAWFNRKAFFTCSPKVNIWHSFIKACRYMHDTANSFPWKTKRNQRSSSKKRYYCSKSFWITYLLQSADMCYECILSTLKWQELEWHVRFDNPMPTVFTIDPRNPAAGKVFISSVFQGWKLFFGSLVQLWVQFSMSMNWMARYLFVAIWFMSILMKHKASYLEVALLSHISWRSKKLLLAKDVSRYVCYTNMQLNLTFNTHSKTPLLSWQETERCTYLFIHNSYSVMN